MSDQPDAKPKTIKPFTANPRCWWKWIAAFLASGLVLWSLLHVLSLYKMDSLLGYAAGLLIAWIGILMLAAFCWPLCLKKRQVPVFSVWLAFLISLVYLLGLPTLRTYMMRARYTAEPVPVVGCLREQIASFHEVHGFLPGLSPDAKYELTPGVNIHLSGLQTFTRVEDDGVASPQYLPAVVSAFEMGQDQVPRFSVRLFDEAAPDRRHFAQQLDISNRDFLGARLKPNEVFYAAWAIEGISNTYVYAVGMFGDLEVGLPPGTGYAVLEIVNAGTQLRMVGEWRRWRSAAPEPGQIALVSAAEHTFSSAHIRKRNICWIGDPRALLSDDRQKVETEVDKLRRAGWEF